MAEVPTASLACLNTQPQQTALSCWPNPHLPAAAACRLCVCSGDALLHAAETRTSAPLRIERTPEGLESPTLPGLYPCGEGGLPKLAASWELRASQS